MQNKTPTIIIITLFHEINSLSFINNLFSNLRPSTASIKHDEWTSMAMLFIINGNFSDSDNDSSSDDDDDGGNDDDGSRDDNDEGGCDDADAKRESNEIHLYIIIVIIY